MSQRQLAQAIEVRPGQISDWERGRFLPALAPLVAIAGALEVSLDELVNGEQTFQQRAAAEARRQMREELPALVAEVLKAQGIVPGR